MNLNSRKVLILCDHFYPAWKLGGAIQSLKNLVFTLSNKMQLAAISSAYDLGQKEPFANVALNDWNDVKGARVRYLETGDINYGKIKELMLIYQPDTVYINGMFSLPFSIYPLIMRKLGLLPKTKFILSPRGMLQDGALKSKSFKKNVFLQACKLINLHKNILWHATDVQEAGDIKKHFGNNSSVVVVLDTPKAPYDLPAAITKKSGELKLVYLSLIAEKKNLHLAIKWIKELNLPITFDIYGPVKDEAYWQSCKELMSDVPKDVHVEYKGEIIPDKVQELFATYHAMLFPTKGENFGHAIYECFSVGRPVITSTETPWKNLEQKKAGYDLPLNDAEGFKKVIQHFYKMEQNDFDEWKNGAHAVAMNYWTSNDVSSAYMKLFS